MSYSEIKTSQTSATSRWEAFEARTRATQENIRDLESEIKVLENKSFQEGQNEHDISKQLSLLRIKYNELTSDKAAANLMRLKQNYYDQVEKPGGLLAITISEDANGNIIAGPLEMDTAFKNFHENLYRSECSISVDDLTDFCRAGWPPT